MSHLIDTTEMYLKTIYELEEDGVAPLRARIVERLGHSGPTVSQTVARMERDGYLRVGRDRTILLTEFGKETARKVMQKHRIAECLLVEVIGVELPQVHEEACRWEHVISDAVCERVDELLREPKCDPYGNVVPRLINGVVAEAPEGEISAADAVDHYGFITNVTFRRIGEPLQSESELLARLLESRILDREDFRLRPEGQDVRLEAGDESVLIPGNLARHLFAEQGFSAAKN